MAVAIRREEPQDAPGVRDANDRAFPTSLESRLVDALRLEPGSLSLVAVEDGRVLGHILFTPVTLESDPRLRLAGLGPMSVVPSRQRQGIGGRLVRAGLDACRAAGYAAVVVLGHPDYYPRFGFVPADTRGLRCEFEAPREAFMVLELEPGALAGTGGPVRYHPAFSSA